MERMKADDYTGSVSRLVGMADAFARKLEADGFIVQHFDSWLHWIRKDATSEDQHFSHPEVIEASGVNTAVRRIIASRAVALDYLSATSEQSLAEAFQVTEPTLEALAQEGL